MSSKLSHRPWPHPARSLIAGGALLFASAGIAAAACGGSVQTGRGSGALALAQRCGTTVQQLQLANPGINMNRPLNGQIVTIPNQKPPQYIPKSVKRGAPPPPQPLTPFGQSPTFRRYNRSLARHHASAAGGDSYTVRPGDTMSAIAARKGVPLGALMAANPSVQPRSLAVGQTISVPSGE